MSRFDIKAGTRMILKDGRRIVAMSDKNITAIVVFVMVTYKRKSASIEDMMEADRIIHPDRDVYGGNDWIGQGEYVW